MSSNSQHNRHYLMAGVRLSAVNLASKLKFAVEQGTFDDELLRALAQFESDETALAAYDRAYLDSFKSEAK